MGKEVWGNIYHKLLLLQVRRGAGVSVTERRVGPQISHRLHTLMTSLDPNAPVK